jgi:hypothetical protein
MDRNARAQGRFQSVCAGCLSSSTPEDGSFNLHKELQEELIMRLKTRNFSDSLNRRGFLVIPRRAVRFLRPIFFFLITSSAFAQTSSQPSTSTFNGQSWWNYVKVLADDNMEGRDTGSEGLKQAEAYVVEQIKADGLQPAGTNGYYQPVKLITRRTLEKNSSLALFHESRSRCLSRRMLTSVIGSLKRQR